MRTIKFRAWNGERMITPVFTWGGVQPNRLLERQFHNDFYDKWMYGIDASNVILEQFTGLYDARGIEIYEGDLVRWKSGWSSTSGDLFTGGEVTISPKGVRFGILDLWANNPVWEEMEVVGNVHENPNHLK